MVQQNFTGSTTFVVPSGVTTLTHLVKVAGGGGGGCGDLNNNSQGAGGAGGVVHETGITVVPGETLTITVGAAGAGAPSLGNGTNGGNSTVVGSVSGPLGVTAVGGGGGSRRAPATAAPNGEGNSGGSGGGGGSWTATSYNPAGGAGTAGQGNNGGQGRGDNTTTGRQGGGGGGAGATGGAGTSTTGGTGGAGVDLSSVLGTGVGAAGWFGGGGSGGQRSGVPAAGGQGGGGVGGTTFPVAATAGAANTGGGGGGGASSTSGITVGASGGSGFVALTYGLPAPGVPTSVASPGVTNTTADLSWSAPVTGGAPTGYEVRIDGGAASTATSPHTFTGLTAGTAHTLEVRAVNATGASAWVSVGITTTAPPGVPTTVAAVAHHSSIDLSWAAPSGGGSVTSYEVRIDGGAASTATSPHTFTGLTASTAYTVSVRAVGPGGSSAWVDVAVTALAAPPAGYYRVALDVGPYSWDVAKGDCEPFGVRLPVSLGWTMPDQVEFFPCQADQTTMNFQVLVENAHDLDGVDKGSTVTFAMFVDNDPDAVPWQTFTGIVTQLDGAAVDGVGFLVTVYATDDTARLAGMVVGYTGNWPQESIGDRVQRICTEAGIGYDTFALGTGLGGILAARPSSPVDALSAIRTALKDAADEDLSTDPFHPYYGRHVLRYLRNDDTVAWDATAAADTTVTLSSILRRVVGEWATPPDPQQLWLDGCQVEATGAWAKLPGPDGRTWALVDGTTFGTPSGPPLVRNTSLVDITPGFNPSADTRDNLGESLVPDGSTFLAGWYARTLRYQAHALPDPMGPAMFGLGVASWAPLLVCIPVVVEDVVPAYDLEDLGYLAGTLTGARLVIPPSGRFYVDLRLRPELLSGMELP